MKKKLQKALRRAYRQGRKEGFDHGLNVANMIYANIAADLVQKNDTIEQKNVELKAEIEKLNSELILGEDEDGCTD